METGCQMIPMGISHGSSFPLGATVHPEGVNFSVFSKSSTAVDLLLFDHVDADKPACVISFDPRKNRTAHYWHMFVPGLKPGQIYAYRAHGPFKPQQGLRFDRDKVLLDPYGKAIALPKTYSRIAACRPGDNTATAMKSVVAAVQTYDWEGDAPLKRAIARTVIYEMHVGAFTRHADSDIAAEKRGTYAGVIEKVPYLQDLGITAVELLPVFQFDEQDSHPGFANYWGYSPVSFFSPHHAYCFCEDPLGPIDEFRDMVKALHKAGIEVILDVVFNHTAEGNHEGPTLCYRGLENAAYYILEQDRARYANYSGTGNTLNANQPIVRRLIIDSLHYWVEEMHVDGFRFDLASILSRDERGRPLENPPTLWDIDSDPVLAGTKLIAEAWDAAGLYQVGSFIGDNWKEWNGKFRDDVRRFMKGDNGTVTQMAQRLVGSPDLYGRQEREPEKSINFVTCHDGFTLNDLVSYNGKHNEANGEGNRDGTDNNLSWNCGAEGPTDEPSIEHLRNRQVKNFLALTLLSVGGPMLLMGDEIRRTQRGNNNAYCQDNDITWFDWRRIENHADIYRFARLMIMLRLSGALAREEGGLTLNEILRHAGIDWHGIKLNRPDWSHESHSLAFTARTSHGVLIHVMVNAYWEPLGFEVPPVAEGCEIGWRRCVDTSMEPPNDIFAVPDAPPVQGPTYLVHPRSVVFLFGRVPAEAEVAARPNA